MIILSLRLLGSSLPGVGERPEVLGHPITYQCRHVKPQALSNRLLITTFHTAIFYSVEFIISVKRRVRTATQTISWRETKERQ